MHPHHVLVTVTGFDRPGVISALFPAFAAHDVEVLDVEQMVIRGRLVLGVALALHGDPGALRRAATLAAEALGTEIEVINTEDLPEPTKSRPRHHVVVLGRPLRAGAVGEIARRIADLGGNVEAICRLGDDVFIGLELIVSGADHHRLATTLVTVAVETGTDIAMERAGLRRRSKRLVLFDADRTLLPTDTLGALAELAGRGTESARLVRDARQAELLAGASGRLGDEGPLPAPAAALDGVPAGRLDGHRLDGAVVSGLPTTGALTAAAKREAELLRARVALLAGLPITALQQVRSELRWAPGADALVTRLQRMGYRCGAVSGGAAQIVEPLLDRLGLDFAVANRLEVGGGRLTGRLVDAAGLHPAGKAQALARFADAYGVPLSQTVSVGGLGGIDLVGCAALGIAVGTGAGRGWTNPPAPRESAPAAGHNGAGGPGEVSYAEALLVILGLGADGAEGEIARTPLPVSHR
jgi:phosphoserine phosphatase